MLAAAFDTGQAAVIVNTALLVLGGGCALGCLVWVRRGGRWPDPLEGVVGGSDGPTVVHAVVATAAFLVLETIAASVVLHGQPRDAVEQLGSSTWHMAQNADAAAKLLTAALLIWILSRHRSFAQASRKIGVRRIVTAAVVATLVITTVCTVQLQACTIVWSWLHPEEVPPVHPVLQALRNTAWGDWGRGQLFVAAVVVAPLSEELFFRGVVLQAVWRHTRHAWLAVVFSGMTFGMIHGQPQDVLPLCTMGMILGFVRLRTRSLTACVLVHALFNARTMIMAIYFPELLDT